MSALVKWLTTGGGGYRGAGSSSPARRGQFGHDAVAPTESAAVLPGNLAPTTADHRGGIADISRRIDREFDIGCGQSLRWPWS